MCVEVTRFTHRVIVTDLENVGNKEKSRHFEHDQQPLHSNGLIAIVQVS